MGIVLVALTITARCIRTVVDVVQVSIVLGNFCVQGVRTHTSLLYWKLKIKKWFDTIRVTMRIRHKLATIHFTLMFSTRIYSRR